MTQNIFLCGCVYKLKNEFLGGHVQKIGRNIFVYAERNREAFEILSFEAINN